VVGVILNQERSDEANNIDFLDVVLVLAKEWRRIVAVGFAMLVAGGLIAHRIRPSFTASAAILPPQQQQSVSGALLGQLGPLAAMSGGGGSIFKNPADLYVGMLEGRTVADHLIDTFHLVALYKTGTRDDARARLKGHSAIEAAKDGLITISVSDHDARRASDLANGYVDALYSLNASMAVAEAAQRRVFFDQELMGEKAALAEAEDKMKNAQQKTGVIQLNGQAQVIIQSIAQLQAEITSREVQLQSLKTFATEQNPETIRAEREISSLKEQLASMENSQGALAPGNVEMPAQRVPEAALEYARELRDLRYHEALYDLLVKQYEAARIDEAKSVPLIQVVDRAVPPDKPSNWPPVLVALGAGLFGLLGACVWVLVRHGFRRMKQEPGNSVRLTELRRAFRLNR
jgi:tyrosine-protein kinase Etk/Wzc